MMVRGLATKERASFFICSLAGLVLYAALRQFWWAGYAASILTYHLFLAFLLLFGEKRRGPSFSWPITVTSHLFCVALLLALKYALAMAFLTYVRSQPVTSVLLTYYYGARLVRVAFVVTMYGAAFWEVGWLFGGERDASHEEEKGAAPPMFSLDALLGQSNGVELMPATGADHEAWVQHRAQNRSTYDPRWSPKDDFERWLRARGKSLYAATGSGQHPIAGD